ncbi:extracellular solute-binding protein [Paenibacillus sabuli]|nr:extracellular solute-binding protein [Paenibacillus sabuli]
MNKKGFVAAGLMLSLAIAGCSSNDGGGSADNGNGADGNEPKEKANISSAIYDRGSVPAAEGSIEDNRWTRWLSENGPANVTFTAVPRWESEDKYNTLLASGSAPDLLFEYSPAIRNIWYQQKQLLPLDELIEEHSTSYKAMLEDYPALRKAGTLDDGKLYYFGRLNEVVPNRAVLIRKDWLDKLGLEYPKTTEELYEVAKAFRTEDPDGNGKDDTYGLAVSGNSTRTLDQIFQKMGFVLRDDEIVYAWDSFEEEASFMKRLYEEGIIDRDFLNDKNGENARQDFVTGKLGIYPVLLNWKTFTTNEYKTLKDNVPDAEIIPIPYPESRAGAFTPTFANPVQMTAAINRGADNPEAVMAYVDFLIEPSTGQTLKYGVEGEHYEMGENGCPVALDNDKTEQVGYTVDLQMLMTAPYVLEGKCGMESEFNPEVPLEQEGLDLFHQGLEAYIDLDRPYSEITISEHMPQMPKELQTTLGETNKTIGDLYSKAIVSGSNYTVQQALEEAQKVFQNGMGPEAEAWLKDWYANNKDTAFLAEDLYAVIREQQGIDK